MKHPTLARVSLFLLIALGFLAAPAPVRADDGPATAEKPKTEVKKAEIERRPLLWMVEGSPRVFLYGTIHVPDKRVTKHLPVVQAAFDQSTALYTELKLDKAAQMQMQMTVFQMASMPDKTLGDVLGADLHARVAKLMPPQIPFAMLGNTKPWLTQIILVQTLVAEHNAMLKRKAANAAKAEAKEDESGEGAEKDEEGEEEEGDETEEGQALALDPLLYAQAQEAGKTVGGLEDIATQLKPFDGMSLEAQVRGVTEVVDEIERLKRVGTDAETAEDKKASMADPFGKMLDLWLAGDEAGFAKLFAEETKRQGGDGEEAEKFLKAILDDRNVGMVEKIRDLMKADPKQTYFIAVGTGHMFGENGLVSLLTKAGHTVKRMELDSKIPALPKSAPEPVPAGK